MTAAEHRRPDDPAAGPGPVPDRPPDGVRLAEAARDFGVTERQLRRDLDLLWMCGLPGYGPGDLIDLSFEGDRVRVTFTAGMVRPLRLTTDEAVALIVALRTLLELPGLAEREAVSRALAKVSAAAGHAAEVDARWRSASTPASRRSPSSGTGWSAAARCTCTTTCPRRDERTERTVDPMRLLLVDGHWYLEAWCRRVEGVRLFRLDRVDDVVVLDEPAAPPPQAHERDVDERRLPARAEAARGAAAAGPQRPLGRRLLPGRGAGRGRRPARRAGGHRAHRRTWPGPAGWWPPSAATALVDEPAELADAGRRRRPGRAGPVRASTRSPAGPAAAG